MSDRWPPTLLGWVLDHHLQDQALRVGGRVVRWALEADRARLVVSDDRERRLAAVQFSVVWDPGAPGPEQGRELALHFDVLGLDAPHVGRPVRQDVERRIARLGRWLRAVERRLPETLAELFPRDGDGAIDWACSPLSDAGAGAPTAAPGYVKLGNIGCDLRCVFCTRSMEVERGRIPTLFYAGQIYDAARTLGRADPAVTPPPKVTVGGDEPLRHPDLSSLLRLIRHRGFRPVLQTSAVEQLDADRLDALRRAGLSQVELPLYGATAAVHDAVVGVDGHFEALLRATALLRGAQVPVWMHAVALRHNHHELTALIGLAKELSGHRCGLLYPRDEGRSRVPLEALLVPLSELPAEARHALTFDVPCLDVGKGERRSSVTFRELVGTRSKEAADSMQHHFGERCAGCAVRPDCDGLPAGYLERFGEDELQPW